MTVLSFPTPDHEPVRNTDPETSHKAARINQHYRNQLRFNMLHAHGVALRDNPNYLGFTDTEIAIRMDLPVPPNGGSQQICYWKRHGELLTDYGMVIELKDRYGARIQRRVGRGELQRVLYINERGLEHLDEVLGRYPTMTEREY